jgi:hypothetical protein
MTHLYQWRESSLMETLLFLQLEKELFFSCWLRTLGRSGQNSCSVKMVCLSCWMCQHMLYTMSLKGKSAEDTVSCWILNSLWSRLTFVKISGCYGYVLISTTVLFRNQRLHPDCTFGRHLQLKFLAYLKNSRNVCCFRRKKIVCEFSWF